MTSPNLTATSSAPATRPSSPRFYRGMAVAFLFTVVVGFSNSTRSRIASGAPPLTPFVIAHAALFASWFVIFLVQATLVATGRVAWHRRLGWAAAVVAALITVDGPYVAVAAARRGALGNDGLSFMLVMIGDVVGLAVCVALAVYYRRRSETHKRLMLLGTTSMLPPALSRWPWIASHQVGIAVVLVAYLAAAPVYDLLNGRRVHRASLWGGLALFASAPIRFALAHSAAWHRVATWLIR